MGEAGKEGPRDRVGVRGAWWSLYRTDANRWRDIHAFGSHEKVSSRTRNERFNEGSLEIGVVPDRSYSSHTRCEGASSPYFSPRWNRLQTGLTRPQTVEGRRTRKPCPYSCRRRLEYLDSQVVAAAINQGKVLQRTHSNR
jgi:hypothetical protein